MSDYEKLGAFYLGRVRDAASATTTGVPLLYDSRDLTTHAVIVGMTGSGKTGLAVSLLEEAAIDGVPAIAIDPKGDLGNLLLTFPGLRPADFRPWVDEGEAARAGKTPDQAAQEAASRWEAGLAAWGQGPERIARFRASVDLALYTPGSAAGRPLAALRGFAAPRGEAAADAEATADRIAAAVSGLLALAGIDADPASREHVLLSALLDRAWKAGEDLDLEALVSQVPSPPLARIGVLELEAFYPSRERFELARRLNGVLASPGLSAWRTGEPLDVRSLLWTAEGRPRLSILSIAHLSDAERMFFVTLLLGEVVAWMRAQPGTGSLRALLYMDEVFGYLPPTAVPPSKPPMLTLLKQARAFGLGVALATQNPVDLDYKALSNAGTWFLGRLQTERDRMRVLDGLEGSAAGARGFDRAATDRVLAGLGPRVFLMNDVHEDAPVLFETRWALSYLRGPLTRAQIAWLQPPAPAVPRGAAPAAGAPAAPAPAAASARPVLPAEIAQVWLGGGPGPLRPGLLARARLHYASAPLGIDHWETIEVHAPFGSGGGPDWDAARVGTFETGEEPGGASYAPLPPGASKAASYAGWGKALREHLYRTRALPVFRCAELKLASRPGEDEGAFRIRVAQAARERRDAGLDKVRDAWAAKVGQLEQRIARAEERVAREQSQVEQQRVQTAVSVGATVLGALFGRKLGSATIGRATTAARGAARTAREAQDVAQARADLERLRAERADLEARMQEALAAVAPEAAVTAESLAPRKADLAVERVVLAWGP